MLDNLFFFFCYRLVDILCVIINGMMKSVMYEFGGEVDRMSMVF